MTELEARVLRIEQLLDLKPHSKQKGRIHELHNVEGYSIQEANVIAKKEAIENEFVKNITSIGTDK